MINCQVGNIMVYLESGIAISSNQVTSMLRDFNSGFNIFKSINGSEYDFLETIYYEDGVTEYTYPDTITTMGQTICYKVSYFQEVWGDYCEAFCTALENPDEDFVCATFVEIPENKKETTVLAFPNPTNNQLSITSNYEMNQLMIYDYLGRLVFKEIGLCQTDYTLYTYQFTDGIYIVKIKTMEDMTARRYVVIHK